MEHIAALGVLTLGLVVLVGCAAEPRSGAAPDVRRIDPLDPVDAFPQTHGPYMRQ